MEVRSCQYCCGNWLQHEKLLSGNDQDLIGLSLLIIKGNKFLSQRWMHGSGFITCVSEKWPLSKMLWSHGYCNDKQPIHTFYGLLIARRNNCPKPCVSQILALRSINIQGSRLDYVRFVHNFTDHTNKKMYIFWLLFHLKNCQRLQSLTD